MGTVSQRTPRKQEPRASTVAERRALLQRVLWSPQVAKSSRIREFLEFVCEQTLQDPSAEIHEQEIGFRVFGRKPDYDTAVDNVVRVTASQARKKLEQYFSTQGATEPCVLEIPKGGYTPVFREREAAADPAEPAVDRAVGQAAPHRVNWLAVGIPWLLVMGLAAWILVWSLHRPAAPRVEASPSIRALWSQLLVHDGHTDVVVADSALSLLQELKPRNLTLPEYLGSDIWSHSELGGRSPEQKDFTERMAQRRLTSIGSAITAFRIAELAGSTQANVSMVAAHDFNIHQLKSDNVILLGSIIANPWVGLVEDRLNFRFGFDRAARFAYFENRNPAPGESKVYQTDSNVTYCVVAFLPNLAHTGNILVISGAEVEGTEGGGEFLTSEHTLDQLRSLVKVSGGRFPYFEVLLKSSKIGGSTPGFAPVAFRTLKP